jgi:SPOR domain
MRIVVFLLLFANLTFFAYTKLDAGSGEGIRLNQQVQADKIKLLTSQEVAALGPAKVASLADVCVEFGPFSDVERTQVLADLEPLALGRLLTQRRVDFDNTFSVITGPFATKAAAETRVAESRRQGAKDTTVLEVGRGQYAISFGVFRTEQGALDLVEELGRLGVRLAKVQPHQQTLTQTLLVVRDPQQPVVAKLKDMQPQYAGTDIKVGTCAGTS